MTDRTSIPIRPACVDDAIGIARVHVDSWRATYKGLMPDTILDNLSYEQREQGWRRQLSTPGHGFVYVACAPSGQIVGFVSGGPNRDGDPTYKGELYAIYVLPAYQGQGIGRRLMLMLVERLIQAGCYTMLLWVLVGNPAYAFYEHMGGRFVKRRTEQWTGAPLEEMAYGWEDIRQLR
jgi:ribosomal protein S18 acetylase RimI-like enzyme